jgi:hypothetical protein
MKRNLNIWNITTFFDSLFKIRWNIFSISTNFPIILQKHCSEQGFQKQFCKKPQTEPQFMKIVFKLN